MSYKPQTLVVLSPGFPKDESDTTCLPLQQSLLKAIKQNHPDLNVIVLAFQYPFKEKNYSWNNIPVKAFGGKGRAKVFRIYNWVNIWLYLKKIRKTHNLCGILSFWLGECAFIGTQFARIYNLKHYCWILGQDAKAGNRYVKMIKPKATSLIAISNFVAGNVQDNYGIIPGHVITGGIDVKQFGKLPNKERSIDILGAGSLIPLKQYHLFLEVVCRLRKSTPNIKVVLCGDGPEKKTLVQMIKKLRLEDNVTLTGSIPHTEVLALMQQSKVFLHPSNYEGLVMVCLEALYAGAKIISFVRCMDEAINNWHIAKSTLEMAEMAEAFLKNPDTIYAPTIPYSIEKVASQMVSLYIDKPLATSLKREAIAEKESVD